ncbi:hypothetical protein VTI74DRAFT_9276 [Chaetomium olivicolor]
MLAKARQWCLSSLSKSYRPWDFYVPNKRRVQVDLRQFKAIRHVKYKYYALRRKLDCHFRPEGYWKICGGPERQSDSGNTSEGDESSRLGTWVASDGSNQHKDELFAAPWDWTPWFRHQPQDIWDTSLRVSLAWRARNMMSARLRRSDAILV